MTVVHSDPALQTAADFFAAVDSAQWERAADFVDPDLAVTFRERELAFLLAWLSHRDAIAELGEGNDVAVGGSVPARVDAILLRQYRAVRLSGPPHIETVADLAELSPRAFVAACLEPRNGGLITPDGTQLRFTRPIVGGVYEGDTMMHVLFRLEGPGVQQTDPLDVDVIRVVKSSDAWHVDPISLQFGFASVHSFTHLEDVADDSASTDVGIVSPDA